MAVRKSQQNGGSFVELPKRLPKYPDSMTETHGLVTHNLHNTHNTHNTQHTHNLHNTQHTHNTLDTEYTVHNTHNTHSTHSMRPEHSTAVCPSGTRWLRWHTVLNRCHLPNRTDIVNLRYQIRFTPSRMAQETQNSGVNMVQKFWKR